MNESFVGIIQLKHPIHRGYEKAEEAPGYFEAMGSVRETSNREF